MQLSSCVGLWIGCVEYTIYGRVEVRLNSEPDEEPDCFGIPTDLITKCSSWLVSGWPVGSSQACRRVFHPCLLTRLGLID